MPVHKDPNIDPCRITDHTDRTMVPQPSGKDHEEEASSKAKTPPKKRGWNEIESMFESKKEGKKSALAVQEQQAKEKKQQRKEKYKHKQLQEETADEFASRCRGEKATWVDDGLGGKFNGEGYTGRVEDGVRVFKGHVLDKPDAGTTNQCPFDCDCCFI